MNTEDGSRAVESRTAEVKGVVWTLMLVGEPGEWAIHAETLLGDGPEPFRTSDEAEARDIFENFESYLLGETPVPSSHDEASPR